MSISVVGLGKLGLPLAAVLAEEYDVLGVDTDPERVRQINEGTVETFEPDMPRAARLIATTDAESAAASSDISFILVPTPSTPTGKFSTEYVKKALIPIIRAIKNPRKIPHEYLNRWPIVVLVSTVCPGACRELHAWMCREAGTDEFHFLYNPEFVALGAAVQGMRDPAAVLVGIEEMPSRVSNEFMHHEGVVILKGVYERVIGTRKYHVMTWEEAEWTKLLLNCTLSVKATLANEYAAELIGAGLDAGRVLGFIGADPRIGHSFFGAGPQPGGTCLPRDLRAARNYSSANSLVNASYVFATEVSGLVNGASKIFDKDWRVGILGLGYKEGVPIFDESLGVRLTDYCVDYDIPFMAHDEYDCPGVVQDSLDEVLSASNVVFITLPRQEYRKVLFYPNVEVIVDPWGLIKPEERTAYVGAGGVVWQGA